MGGAGEAAVARLQCAMGGDNSQKYTILPKYFSRKPKYLDRGGEKQNGHFKANQSDLATKGPLKGEMGGVCPQGGHNSDPTS